MEVHRSYRESIAELTFNSRPIITSLTIIAGENLAHANVIVDVIEAQLRNVAPNMKLPILYLMDSICKNIGPVYSSLFSRNLFASFSNAYAAVSPADKEKFRKVVNTWKLADPKTGGGRPLFGAQLTGQLEAFMMTCGIGGGGSHSGPQQNMPGGWRPPRANVQNRQQIPPQGYQSSNRQPQRPPPQAFTTPAPPRPALSVSSIILQQQIQALLTQKQNAVLLNARDTASRDQISILTQLLVHVGSASLSDSDSQTISQSLTSMMQPAQSPNLMLPVAAPPAIPALQSIAPLVFPTNVMGSSMIPGYSNRDSNYATVKLEDRYAPRNNGNSASKADPSKKVDLIQVKLTNADINRTIHKAFQILYDPSTLQCKQCGMRFPGHTDLGRKKNSAHLDWHFRQNKRLREKGGRRAVCREWYLDEPTWIKEDLNPEAVDAETTDKAGDLFATGASGGGGAAAAPVEEVVVQHDIPAEGEANMQCSICKETLEQYYNEDEDLWMIKNALKVNGVLYHQSCYSMSSGEDGKRKLDDGLTEGDAKKLRL
ncbi:hypothetical protein HDU77_008117 [Chytriomyces hyalinus]|nr:hypothetical protein HDU77_008117 [Chytriomyces hyalinus]